MHTADNERPVIEALLSDYFNVQNTSPDISSLVTLTGAGILRLNFTGIRWLNSSQIGQLLVVKKRITQGGGQLTLCRIAPALLEVLRPFAFDRLFHIDHSDSDSDGENCGAPIPRQPTKPLGGAAATRTATPVDD
ncbi:MAG: hypothetical protein U0796_12215 [Gemmatales bacterium]